MLKFINLKKFTNNTLIGVLIAGSLLTQTASSNSTSQPVGISSLDTSRENAANTTSTVCNQSGSNCQSMDFGTGKNIKLNGFKVGSKDYKILKLVDEAKFRRVNNNQATGERHIYFLEEGSNGSVKSSEITTMEEAVRSDFINGGTDNVFANQGDGNGNNNNIERVDFLINDGLLVKENFVNDAGFLLLERHGNDPFKIAAITAVDVNGNPTAFGKLVDVPTSKWGKSDINIETRVIQTNTDWDYPRNTTNVGKQTISGVFVSVASLGVNSGQTIYGYALFPNDIDSNSDLIGLTDFPKNTNTSSSGGGLDLISSGGLFIPKNVTEDEVFESASAINDAVVTNEDTSVSGNVLANDTGDGLVVTTTGQRTLTSGALVTIDSDGTFTYNPNSKFESLEVGNSRTDRFSYTMKDSSNNVGSATVTVTINGAADNPVAQDDSRTTDEDTIKWIPVLMNDEDPNTARENLTITKINNTAINVNSQIELSSGATLKLFQITDSSEHSLLGKYILQYDPTNSNSLNSLNEGQTATETFTYTVSDPEGNTDQGNATITVTGITDTFAD